MYVLSLLSYTTVWLEHHMYGMTENKNRVFPKCFHIYLICLEHWVKQMKSLVTGSNGPRDSCFPSLHEVALRPEHSTLLIYVPWHSSWEVQQQRGKHWVSRWELGQEEFRWLCIAQGWGSTSASVIYWLDLGKLFRDLFSSSSAFL